MLSRAGERASGAPLSTSVRLRQPAVGLYVHLPWCLSKCPYCDFNSHALKGPLPEARYRRSLLRDLQREASRAPFPPVSSVFFGGGTPSLFDARTVEAVLAWLDERGLMETGAEVTLEANPGAAERGAFSDYAAAGVNRVSLGVQSFSDAALKALGRVHDAGDARDAVEAVHGAGIPGLNLDLMYGLPGQTAEHALEDVERALDAGPSHISHYQLTLEPNTLFAVRPPALPSEETVWRASAACGERLGAAGFHRYEISAYAPAGRQCRHNLNYWRFGDYLGIGAGAHGKRTHPDADRIVRTWKTRHPDRYMARSDPLEGQAEIRGEDRIFEFMLNALRLVDGFADHQFGSATGLGPDRARGRLERARDRGLVERTPGPGWRATELGLRFLNDLQSMFLPDAAD